MNVTLDLSTLLSALRTVGPALARTNPVRMASCGWIARDGRVTLRAASLDWDAQYTIPARVAAPGEAWMPADLARALPWGRLADAVQLRAAGRELEIRSGGLAYALPTLDPDAAAAPVPALVPCAEAPGGALARTLLLGASAAHLGPAAGGETSPAGEPERDGAWIEAGSGRLAVRSTDRVRIAAAETAITGGARFRAALPIHAAVALARAAAASDTAALLRATREPSPVLAVTAGAATVTVRALAALPPDPAGIDLDAERAATAIRAGAGDLVSAMRSALAVAGTDPGARVRLRTRRAHLEITVACGGGRAAASVPLRHAAGPEADAVLPGRALLAALAPLRDAEVTVGFGVQGRPALVAAADGEVAYRGLVAAGAAARERASA